MFKDLFNLKLRSFIGIHYLVGVKFLRPQLKFNILNKHKFYHNFKDAPSPMCDCGSETETTDHFFLRGLFSAEIKQQLLNGLYKIAASLNILKK